MSGPEHRVAAVCVEAASRLATEQTGGNHPPQQRWTGGARIERDRIERLAQTDLRIEADEIDQLEWPHLVAEADLDRGVDAGGVGDARVHRANGIVVERHQQRIEDEARLVLGLYRNLPAGERPI